LEGEDRIMSIIAKRSIEKAKLDIRALESSGADSMEVMADLNRVVWKIIADSVKAEYVDKKLSEEELVRICRKIALLGRRDRSSHEGL
jgi:AAA+ ATPase superfamily predicted ATPase